MTDKKCLIVGRTNNFDEGGNPPLNSRLIGCGQLWNLYGKPFSSNSFLNHGNHPSSG